MARTASRWLFASLVLLMLLVWGCTGGGAPKPPTDPDDPFIPSGPGGGGTGAVTQPAAVNGAPGDQQILVTFAPAPGADGYNLYLSEDGSTFVRFNSNSPYTTTSILVTGLENGKLYFVGVSAVFGNRESNTSYAGGSPSARPIIPSADPIEPGPLAVDVVQEITLWSQANTGITIPSVPNDRRLLFSWKHTNNPDVVNFRVRFYVAGRNLDGSLRLPTTIDPSLQLISFDQLTQPIGARARLSDPSYGVYDDPAMGLIRPNVVVPPGQSRTEGVLSIPYGSNILAKVVQNSGLSGSAFISLLTQPAYGYTEANLGLDIQPNGTVTGDQNALDGVDRLGVAVGIAAVFTDGSISNETYAFGYYTDGTPELVPALSVIPVANPAWDPQEETSSPVLPQLNWNRLRFPMGSDINDYGIIRRGAVERGGTELSIVYRLSADGPNAVFEAGAPGGLRRLLVWTDNKPPRIIRGELYSYQTFAIDRSGRTGGFSVTATIRPGGAFNQPPTAAAVLTQGATELYPNGDGTVQSGPTQPQVQVDMSASMDPEGSTLDYFYRIAPGQTDFAQAPGPVFSLPTIECVGGNTAVTLFLGVVDGAGNASTPLEIPLTVVPGPDCGG